jgi:predicted glycoside hydrolase/deacetylase ChbG (UPF0249 family)
MKVEGAFILCADDFAISRGVSEGILSLAQEGRLSATSAIVTAPHWPAYAKAVMQLRSRFAVGLHLNLTFGRPLGPMRVLARDGQLPNWDRLFGRLVAGRVDRREIAAEIDRQLDRFEGEAGFPPDFVDGHQHVHVFPIIRHLVMEALERRFPARRILLRDPSDSALRIARRRIAAGRALGIAAFALSFPQLAVTRGFLANAGFSGFSTFGRIPYEREFEAFLRDPGPRHMIMCHPGFADDELGTADAIAHRRPEEYAVLSRRVDIPDMIWRANRTRCEIGCQWPVNDGDVERQR